MRQRCEIVRDSDSRKTLDYWGAASLWMVWLQVPVNRPTQCKHFGSANTAVVRSLQQCKHCGSKSTAAVKMLPQSLLEPMFSD